MRYAPLLIAAAMLGACSDSKPGGDLAVAVVGEGGLADDLAEEASRATLIRRGPAGELVPGLATSWRFLDDGNDLILRLAPQRWPAAGDRRGPELAARDVTLGWRRAGAEGRAALAAAGLDAASALRAPIARVIELTPSPATPQLLDWLAEPALAVRDRRGRLFPGLYTARRDGEDRRGWLLDRRDDRSLPDARAAAIRIAPRSAADAIAAFARGDVQLVLGEGLAGLGAARASGQGRALRVEAVQGVSGLAINAAKSPLSDARLRRALLLAADGEALANRVALAALTAQNLLWDGLPPPEGDRALPLAARRAKAAALLREAGHDAEHPLRLTLLLPAGPDHRAIAETLAASLAPVGIQIVLQAARPGGYAEARLGRQQDLAWVDQTVRVPDVVAHLAQWRCGRARPCRAEADRRLDEAERAGNNVPARQAAATAAERLLMQDPAFVPLLRPVRWALVAGDVDGYQANSLGRHPLGRISAGKP
ncbi:MAG: ABC transporter substrate-binding protein [Sphingomonadales bacterium]|jgi:ABC-type transport system substrate-binding protein